MSPKRMIYSLNGVWQIEESDAVKKPDQYDHTVPVPGLVDLATPPFQDVGLDSGGKRFFWYRKSFQIWEEVPLVALLKIHKGRYGKKVWLNGNPIGDHLPCFTPAVFDIKSQLKGCDQENILEIRLGDWLTSVPESVVRGFDAEKQKYNPGLYDSVEIIFTGNPYILWAQAGPDLLGQKVNVRTRIENISDSNHNGWVYIKVRETNSHKEIGATHQGVELKAGQSVVLDASIPLENFRLWSPEDPYLYELVVETEGDEWVDRFGMRSFSFDSQTLLPVLNGNPYFLRGTNVCLFRFFEDPLRQDYPWQENWVRTLIRKFKEMNWNSFRFCITQAPEMWYRICDEEGILVQDEYPIWISSHWPESLTSDQLIKEFSDWIIERANHPSVVIFDAQNESRAAENATLKAIHAVRKLDLSDRPWDNGWDEPDRPSDPVERHPYFFEDWVEGWGIHSNQFTLEDLSHLPIQGKVTGYTRQPIGRVPWVHPDAYQGDYPPNHPILNNEYEWIWINRDGTPTVLTRRNWERIAGQATYQQRKEMYARLIAAITEFWRSQRTCAAVHHFCGLSYSISQGGATSDNFTPEFPQVIEFDPYFARYVKDAFAPVGLMIDFFEIVCEPGLRNISIALVNDLPEDWSGEVRLRILSLEKDRRKVVREQKNTILVDSFGQKRIHFRIEFPPQPGAYCLEAEYLDKEGSPVRSLRDIFIK